MGLKGGVRKGRDSQVPGPYLRILSRWQQLFIGCRCVEGTPGSLGVPDADLPSLGCGLGTSMFTALPPDDSDVRQDRKPPAVRATSSLHSQMRGPASSERLRNFL